MRCDGRAMRVLAPAKINLYLEVIGRRDDGYHDIVSVVAPISLHDTLFFERTSDGRITTIVENQADVCGLNGEEIASSENIATKAALLLKSKSHYRDGVRITIRKEIPISGGLGGGSADAAMVLHSLNSLWELGFPREKLVEMAAEIGCDVPALVHGGIVLVEGRGERVRSIGKVSSRSAWWLVLANVGMGISTGDIYRRTRNFLTSPRGMLQSMLAAIGKGDLDLAGRSLFNALQQTVFRKYPLIEMLAEELQRAGAVGVALSGSGGTVFALAKNERHARSIADSVARSLGHPLWRRVTRILPDGVMAAHGPLEA